MLKFTMILKNVPHLAKGTKTELIKLATLRHISCSGRLNENKISTDSFAYIESNDPETLDIMKNDFLVKEDFLTESDELSLLTELEPYMKRLRYEFDHWDNVGLFHFRFFIYNYIMSFKCCAFKKAL